MKKFLTCIFALLLIIPFSVGCATSTRYKDVYTELNDMVNDPQYTEYFDGDITLQGVNKYDVGYESLTYYDGLIGMSLSNIKNCYGAFMLEPYYNKTSTRKVCDKVLREVSSYKSSIANFIEGKTYVENIVAEFGADSNHALMEVSDFYEDYGKLVEKSNNLQTAFTNAFTTLYHPDITKSPETSFDVQLALCEVFADMVNDCVQYAVMSFDYVVTEPTSLFYSLQSLQSAITYGIGNFKTENYSQWLKNYTLFKSEESMFLTALDKIDIKNKTIDDFTGLDKTYFTKIDSFISTNASAFISTTMTLLC